jgi:dephospho-CoA kinase
MANSSILTRKKNLLSWIESLQDRKVLKILENIKEEVEEKTGSHLLPGNPMTISELKERVMNAHNAILKDEYVTHEDLKKEMKKW